MGVDASGAPARAAARWALAVLAAAVTLPVAVGAAAQLRERRNDTRILAEHWLAAHAPPGARVLVEYPALALLATRLEFLYPAGAIGCIDGRRTLAGTVKLPAVDRMRGTGREARAVLDIGTIDPARLGACPADIALLSDYDRYLAEADRYPGRAGRLPALPRARADGRGVRACMGAIGRPDSAHRRTDPNPASRWIRRESVGDASTCDKPTPVMGIGLTSQVRTALPARPGMGSGTVR